VLAILRGKSFQPVPNRFSACFGPEENCRNPFSLAGGLIGDSGLLLTLSHCTTGGTQTELDPKIKIPTLSLQRAQGQGWALFCGAACSCRALPGRTAEGGCPHMVLLVSLHQALIQHRVGYFLEAGDVGAVYRVAPA
jgi:hypothetical protein